MCALMSGGGESVGYIQLFSGFSGSKVKAPALCAVPAPARLYVLRVLLDDDVVPYLSRMLGQMHSLQ